VADIVDRERQAKPADAPTAKRTFLDASDALPRAAGASVLLLDDDRTRGEATQALLAEMGYRLLAPTSPPETLTEKVATTNPSLIIVRAVTASPVFLDQLRRLPAPLRRPVVMFSEDGAPEAIAAAVAAGVDSYVVVGVNGNRIRAAVELARANFAAKRGLEAELDQARAQLRDRKIIEKAKGLIMKERKIDEQDAYALLRKRAMQKGVRMVDVATMINEAAEIMND